MKPVLRGLFVVLALLVLAAQVARGRAEAGAGSPPPLADALAGLGLHPTAPAVPDTLAATAAGCGQAVTVAEADFNGFGQTAGQTVLALPGTPRFVYLGLVGGKPHVAAIATRWAAASLLHVLGLRREKVPRQLVLVMLPRACPELAGLDWSRLSPWR